MPQRIKIGNLNFGGISDSEYIGIENSVPALVGLDLHSKPGLVRVNQKLKKESGDTVDALCKEAVACSDGNSYWFSSTTGKVWKRTSAGAWSLVYTCSPAAGGAGCLGAMEYNEYIYWATESRLHRIAVTGLADWTTNAAPDWGTFTATDASFHPMVKLNGILYIGDGYLIAQVEGDTFTADALDLYKPLRASCLWKIDNDLLIGTFIASNVNEAEIFRWNAFSPSWTSSDPIPECGINAFLPFDNMIVVNVGVNGNLYYYDGKNLNPFKTIPGTWDKTNTAVIHNGSVGNFRSIPVFGLSKQAGDPCKLGVYSLGRRNTAYPTVLSLDFPISQRSGDDLVLANVEIGKILVMGNEILVAWKDTNSTTAYGVDNVDWSNKLSGAFLETRLMLPDRDFLTVFNKYLVNYRSLPTGTAFAFSYSKDYAAAYTAMTEIVDDIHKRVQVEQAIEGIALQLKLTLTASGNTAPEFEDLSIYLQDHA